MKKQHQVILTQIAVIIAISLPAFTLHSQTVTPTQSDKIPVDNGNNKADPGETIRYKVDISASGSDATGVQLNAMPDANTTFSGGTFLSTSVAADDGPYACTGNVPIDVPAASGVLLNDFDDNLAGATLSVVTPPTKGSVMLNNDGSFTYTPNPGVTGMTDQFTYRIDDATIPPDCTPQAVNIQATVTIDISNLIWFIDNSSMAATSDGRLNSPFKTLSDFNGNSAAAGDVIYIEHTGTDYPGGIVLQNNEKLFGEGHTGGANLANVLPFILAPHSSMLPAVNGTRPVVTNAAGDGVQLASGNTLQGFNVGDCSGFGIDDNGAAGTLTVSEVNITNGTGGGWRTDNGGTLAVTLGSLSSTGGANGINLNNCSGAFSVSGTTSMTNSTGTGVSINMNTATVTFSMLNITNTTTNQTGLFASGGTVNSTSGTINTGSGRGVDIDNATLGMTVTSVSSSGGSAPGIDLNTTTGSFTVTGDGGGANNGSGGTISNKPGSTDGVLLTNVTNVSLKYMNINSNLRNGINGNGINGFVLERCNLNNNADQASPDEGAILIDNLSGTATGGSNPTRFTNISVSNSFEHNVQIRNTSGTLSNLEITGSTIQNNGASTQAGNNFFLNVSGGSSKVSFSNCDIIGSTTPGMLTAFGIVADASAGSFELVIDNSRLTSNNVGTSASFSNTGSGSFSFTNNNYQGQRSNAVNYFSNASTNSGTTISGTIQGNTIGTQGSANSGSFFGNGIDISNEGPNRINVLIHDNTIQGVGDGMGNGFEGIFVNDVVSAGTIHATITDNRIRDIFDDRGLVVQTIVGGTSCANITGNTFSNTGGSTDMRIRAVNSSVLNITQGDPAGTAPNLSTVNGNATVTVTTVGASNGTINFNQPACQTP